jgi:hypothetical protein
LYRDSWLAGGLLGVLASVLGGGMLAWLAHVLRQRALPSEAVPLGS